MESRQRTSETHGFIIEPKNVRVRVRNYGLGIITGHGLGVRERIIAIMNHNY